MNEFEAYTFLLKDTIFSNLIFSSHIELALDVMNMTGSYKKIYLLLISSLGTVIAIICNYMLGVLAYRFLKLSKDPKMHARYAKLEAVYLKYGVYFLFLTFIPNIGKFIPFISGFTRYNIVKSIAYGFFSKFIYYLIVVLNLFRDLS